MDVHEPLPLRPETETVRMNRLGIQSTPALAMRLSTMGELSVTESQPVEPTCEYHLVLYKPSNAFHGCSPHG